MIVEGGKPRKAKKQKKKGRNAESLAKDTLKVAIANGTIKDLLWGEIPRTERDDSDESEEEDMEDHSVEIFNELLLRKSSVMPHPESELLTKHRQSVLVNNAQLTFLTVPGNDESHYESVPPPLHTKGSSVDASPRLKQSKLMSPGVSSKKQHNASPGKPTHASASTASSSTTISSVPSLSASPGPHTSHHSKTHHKRRYSREENQDFREILTTSLDIKHKSKAFTDIMRDLKMATQEARRASSVGNTTEREERGFLSGDEYLTAQEELNIVQDNDVLWGGVAGASRKSRPTLLPTAVPSSRNAVSMAELVQISHDLRREREVGINRGNDSSDGGSGVIGCRDSVNNGAASLDNTNIEYRAGSRGASGGVDGSELYMNYTGSNERLDRLKLHYNDGAELSHKAKVEARYAAHMNATLQLKSSAEKHTVHALPPHEHFSMFYNTLCSANNMHTSGLYDVFTAPIVIPTRPNTVPEGGDGLHETIEDDGGGGTGTHSPGRKHHHSPVAKTKQLHSPPRNSPHIHHKALHTDTAQCTIPATNPIHTNSHTHTTNTSTSHTAPLPLRNTTVTDEYIRNIRNAYLSNTIESDSSESEDSVRTNNSQRSTENMTLMVPVESDNDSVSICLASPTGHSNSMVDESVLNTPTSEKVKRTPKQRKGKKAIKPAIGETDAPSDVANTTATPPRSAGKGLRKVVSAASDSIVVNDSSELTAGNGNQIPSTTNVTTSDETVSSGNKPTPRASVRKSIASRPSRVSKYTPRAPTLPTLPIHSANTTETPVNIVVTNNDAVFTDSSEGVADSTINSNSHTSTSNDTIHRVPTAPEMIHNALTAHSHLQLTTTRASKAPRRHGSPGSRSKSSSPQTLNATSTLHTTSQHVASHASNSDVAVAPVLPSTPVTSINKTTADAISTTNTTTNFTTNFTSTTHVAAPPASHYPHHLSKAAPPVGQNARAKSFHAPVRVRSFRTTDTDSSRGSDRSANKEGGRLYTQGMNDSGDEVTDAQDRYLQPESASNNTTRYNGSAGATGDTMSVFNNVVVDSVVHNAEYSIEFEEEFKDGYSVKWSSNTFDESGDGSKLNGMYGSSSDKYNSSSMKYHSPMLSPPIPIDSDNGMFISIHSNPHAASVAGMSTEHTLRHSPPMAPSHHTHSTDTNTSTSAHLNTANTNSTYSSLPLPTGLEHLTGIWPYDPSFSAYKYIQQLYAARRQAAQVQKAEYVRLQRSEREKRRVKQPRQAYPVRHAISETYQVLTFDPEHLHLVLITHTTSTATPLHYIEIPLHTTYITENTTLGSVTLRTTCTTVPNGYLATYSVSQWLSMQSEINSALAGFELSRYKLLGREVEVVVEGDGDVGVGGSVVDGADSSGGSLTAMSVNTTNPFKHKSPRIDDEVVDDVFLTSVSPLAYGGTTNGTRDSVYNVQTSVAYGVGSAVYSNSASPTNTYTTEEVSIDQLRHYAEQGYASFLSLLHTRLPPELPQTIHIEPSPQKPVCVPTVYGGDSGPVRPLLLTKRYTTLTTDNASSVSVLNTAVRKHATTVQPSRFMSLIKDAVNACKAAALEQKRLAQMSILAPPTARSPSTPRIHTMYINEETKRNFKYYDPHSSGIIYNNDGYIAEGSVVGGGNVQLGIEGHVCSGVSGLASGGSVCLPTVPRIPKQHCLPTVPRIPKQHQAHSARVRNSAATATATGSGSVSSVHSISEVSYTHVAGNAVDATVAGNFTSAKSNAVVVPTVSTKASHVCSSGMNTSDNNMHNSPSISGEEGHSPVQPLRIVLLVESRPDMQVHFAELFLQLDLIVDVHTTITDAASAVHENASLYGWILLNYADLCDIGVEHALAMLHRSMGGSDSTNGGVSARIADKSIVFDDESVFVDNVSSGVCKIVVYDAAYATDGDVWCMQQGGVAGILNEPYTLSSLRECISVTD